MLFMGEVVGLTHLYDLQLNDTAPSSAGRAAGVAGLECRSS